MMPTSKDYQPETTPSSGLELALERNVQAPAIARAAISGLCDDLRLGGTVRQTLVLLISEVVSNAVLHSSGPTDATITITAKATPEAVHISVTDAGDGFTPARRDPSRVEGGYGLYLVDKAASRWGVDARSPTKVWFEIPITA